MPNSSDNLTGVPRFIFAAYDKLTSLGSQGTLASSALTTAGALCATTPFLLSWPTC